MAGRKKRVQGQESSWEEAGLSLFSSRICSARSGMRTFVQRGICSSSSCRHSAAIESTIHLTWSTRSSWILINMCISTQWSSCKRNGIYHDLEPPRQRKCLGLEKDTSSIRCLRCIEREIIDHINATPFIAHLLSSFR